MPPDADEGTPLVSPVGAPVAPPSMPTGRSSRALMPPRSLVALMGVSHPFTEMLPDGSVHLGPAYRADHGVGGEPFM
jgi:hypothetical protein